MRSFARRAVATIVPARYCAATAAATVEATAETNTNATTPDAPETTLTRGVTRDNSRKRIVPQFVSIVAEHARLTPSALRQLPPERVVTLAIMCLRLASLRGRLRDSSLTSLPPQSIAWVFQAAVSAVAERRVPLILAARFIGAKWDLSTPQFGGYLKELRHAMLAWVTDAILQGTLTEPEAGELLNMARYLPRNAAIVGTLVEKVLAEPTPTAERLVRVLFAIGDSRVQPPNAVFEKVLQKVLALAPTLKTRQVYRLTVASERVDYPILVRLTPLLVRAWGDMAVNAVDKHRKVQSRFAAQRRLDAVAMMSLPELVKFARISASLGMRYNSTLAPLSTSVIIPLVKFSRAMQLTLMLRALAATYCHDPAVYQAIANKISRRGIMHPLALSQLRQVLRAITTHPDLYRSMRIGGLLELLVQVSHRSGALQQRQLVYFALDAFQLTRRFSRDANVVATMSNVVNEFCLQMVRMVRTGMARMELVHQLLQVTSMLGMRRSPDRYAGMAQLLALRNDFYEGVGPDEYPARYRALQHPAVFNIYQRLVVANQQIVVLRSRLFGREADRLRDTLRKASAFHIMQALRLYNVIHGRHTRLAPRIEAIATSVIRDKFIQAKESQQVEGKARFYSLMPSAFEEVQVKQFCSALERTPIAALRNSPYVIDGLVTLAMAYGDGETKSAAAKLRSSYYRPDARAGEPPVAAAAAAA